MTIKQLKRYIHTLRFMKIKQINYRVYYVVRNKVRKATKHSYKYSLKSNSYKLNLNPSIESYTSYSSSNNNSFTFLNLSNTFNNKIDWNFSDHGKLWTYNLNYFEYLNQKKITIDNGLKLIYDFIENLPKVKDGLEPFPIALRGINWIKFLVQHDIKDQKIDDSLYAQYNILLDNLEYHLLGNHLLENGFSLLFGAYYFADNKLYKKAKDILVSELDEQILSDGAHFELTPMYHQIMFFRVLDCINLISHNDIFSDRDFERFLKQKASKMYGWLKNITYKNGNIPHFNDSTDGIAPTSNELFEYANRLNIKEDILILKESGYRKYEQEDYELVVDVGNIGPDYIPGHAHSDTFNFELYIKNKPFIVDTSISTYENNSQRKYERSTSAHNTVMINNIDQSEIWSSFRVAKRAKVINLEENEKYVSATHNGYLRFGILHTRKFLALEDVIVIEDEIFSKKEQYLESKAYFHFDNSINVRVDGDKVITNSAIFTFEGLKKLDIVDTTIAKGFNDIVEAKCIIVLFEFKLKTNIDII